MFEYIARRLLQAIPTLIGVTLVAFLLLHAAGDPAAVALGPDATQADRQAYRKSYGLDQPLYVQYFIFLGHVVQGDFGESLTYEEPVFKVVLNHLPATIELAIASVFISLLIGIPVGIFAAVKRGSKFDYLVMLGTSLCQSIAQFWLGLMLVMVFSVKLRWFPTSGMGSGASWIKHLVLPAVTLSPWLMALSARLMRSGMLSVLHQDYIRTALAKGLTNWVVLTRHAVRNALIPVIAITGLAFAYLIGGALVIEIIFAWPGVGNLAYKAVLRYDYNIVLCIIVIVASSFIIVNLIADIVTGYVDPRVRIGKNDL